MKTLFTKFAVLFFVTAVAWTPFHVSAQWVDESPSTYQYNYDSYINPNIDFVTSGCAGCGGSWVDESPSTYQYNYNSYTNPNIDYVTSDCVGCGTVYAPTTYGYDSYGYNNYAYPSSYGYTDYGYSTYAYPSYSYPSYTYPSYTYPTVTSPIVTTPVVTTPVTTTVPVTTTTICSDGSAPINGSCTRTNVIPTNTNTICSDGRAPVNGSCVRTNVVPTVTYQTCWDGSTIPLNSVCPSQYKVCANGTSIPVNQTCYYGNNYAPYVPAIQVKFNNAITSVTTEITNNSARCNGIGLIASGASSIGWFEYGETPNLGRETAHANIGSSPTAPFSNKLVNLKASTTYYCRAVMQNQYGTVKGEVVAFTTKAKAVAYVKPVTKTTVKTTVTKKNEVICVDGQVVTVGSQKAASLINAGQKLVTLQIEKVSGALSPNAQAIYRLTVRNISDEELKNVTVKITIPQDVTLTNASAGTYDAMSHVLTVSGLTLAPYGVATVNWTGMTGANAVVGNQSVTTAYASYAVPGSTAQDEVSAYVVGSVTPASDNASSTGSKKVIGVSTGGASFLPNTLIEWLALIAILFIIFVLGRSVYTSYKGDKSSH